MLEVTLDDLGGEPVVGQIVRIVREPDDDLSGSGGQGNPDEAAVLSLGEVEISVSCDDDPPPVGVGPFTRGDCNGDGNVIGQVGDAVFVLNFNFTGGPRPGCMAACDSNGDGNVIGQVGDAIYTLNFNFLGGPPIPAPFPECGRSNDPADVALGCETPPVCR